MSVHKVLIVAGGLLQLKIDACFLDRGSFAVRSATNPEQAIAIASVQRPDLIILPASLPGTTVTAFWNHVREEPGLSNVKLLVVVDGDDAAADDESLADAVTRRLFKTTDRDHLLDAVSDLLGIRARNLPRVEMQVLASVDVRVPGTDTPETIMTNILELSPTGFTLELAQELPVDTEITVHFFLPGSRRRMAVPCVVRRIIDPERAHYAVELADDAGEDRAIISEFVRSREMRHSLSRP